MPKGVPGGCRAGQQAQAGVVERGYKHRTDWRALARGGGGCAVAGGKSGDWRQAGRNAGASRGDSAGWAPQCLLVLPRRRRRRDVDACTRSSSGTCQTLGSAARRSLQTASLGHDEDLDGEGVASG